jgi:predicted Zn-dependent peptidase
LTASLHHLANGVRLVCDPMPGLETLALSVVMGRGARFETLEQSGWSHLLEHMVFKGAGPRSSRQIVEAIEAEGGQINAATGYERTSFQVRALKGGLGLAMEIISDLIRRPTLLEADLVREKQVIGQEIAEAADAPDDYVFDLAQTAAFGDHPLGRPILGTVASIETATPASLEAFRAGLYDPASIVISASGAVDESELLALAEAWFGDAPAHPAALAMAPSRFLGGVQPKVRRLEQAHLVLMLPAPSARNEAYFPIRVFAEALGGGMSSRLFQEARERRGLAYGIDAYADCYQDGGVLGIYAGCAPGDAAELAKVAAGELLALTRTIDGAELSRAKAQLKASLFMARESALARAEQSAGQTLLFDRLFTATEIGASIDAVSADDVRAAGEGLLAPGLTATAVLGNKMASKASQGFSRTLVG